MLLLPMLLIRATAGTADLPPLAEIEEPTTAATTTATMPPATTTAAFRPWVFGLETGLDVPVDQRLLMASARIAGGLRLDLPAGVVAGGGLRTGYSYVAGQGPVADAGLGVDDAAFLMAHRIPIRGEGRIGWRAADGPLDGPVEIGAIGSAGADVVLLQSNAFGRKGSSTALAPGFSVGGYLSFGLGDSLALGLLGEWDAAVVDLASTAPGVSGDLSAARLAITLSFAFGT
ncbi:MAG: hypothetical protein Q8O67_20740 [Deltaproteobacteria bacterium]|nr:hypothetical protein [Deltaproteobacteria bacterium]